MTSQPPLPSANWYPDPLGAPQLRYWNGTQWTEHCAPGGPQGERPPGGNWFLVPLKKYAVFSGRSQRREYWLFILVMGVGYLALGIVDVVAGTFDNESGFGLLSTLFLLGLYVPLIALTARRCHDIGKSGWSQLLFAVPIVGPILWIVWMAREGERQANKYGPPPVGAPAA